MELFLLESEAIFWSQSVCSYIITTFRITFRKSTDFGHYWRLPLFYFFKKNL